VFIYSENESLWFSIRSFSNFAERFMNNFIS
jgi:hypothetical protein